MAKKRTKPQQPDDDAEFSRLFWAARAEHRKKSLANDHQIAMDFAETRGWEWAKSLLEISKLSFERPVDRSLLQRLSTCEQWVPKEYRGHFMFIRGFVLDQCGDYDEAIKEYRDVLNTRNFDAPGNAWYNLGVAIVKKHDYDEAIKAFQTALDTPSFDAPGNAWYNIGLALAMKGNYDEAIKAFRTVLSFPHYDSPGQAWNNLGNALAAKGEYDEAIKAYFTAVGIPDYDMRVRAWTNLAEAYVKAGERAEAEKAFNQALNCPDPDGSQHSRARLGLRVLQSQIEPKALSPDDQALLSNPQSSDKTRQIEDGIIAAIREAGDTQYDKYLREKTDSGRDNVLSILRGWSSAVTLLEGSERRWRGGGYFLKWKGYGIVIDPGFDFLRNFHDAGYHGREINVVIVSHNHPDHNYDLKAIDDLRYELFTRLKGAGTPGSQPYLLIWDRDTDNATKFLVEQPEHRCEPILLTTALTRPIDLSTDHTQAIPIRITPFKVEHETKGDVPHAMGMRLELLDENGQKVLTIGYTADTGYFPELSKHLNNCDLLIAHISQPRIEELQDPHGEPRKVHLGYRGTAKLLHECQPGLTLIGEFWAGFTDLRIPLVKGLRERSGLKNILPAGLGMHLDLPSLRIKCTECGELTPHDQPKIAPPTDRFGSLAYLCADCMIA